MTKPGHEQPNLDNQGERTLFSTAPIQGSKAPKDKYLSFEDMVPQDVRARIKVDIEQGDADWERQDKSGYPPTMVQIRKNVGGAALAAEDIEEVEVAKISKKAKPASRPKKDRRHLGPSQKNTADGDKRVEAAYGKPEKD
jgi:hypothetical protein